ncbi:hypothetical protein [Vibrio casei]
MKFLVPYKFWEAALVCAATNDVRYYLNQFCGKGRVYAYGFG